MQIRQMVLKLCFIILRKTVLSILPEKGNTYIHNNTSVDNEEEIDTLIYEFNRSCIYSNRTMENTIQQINNT